MDLYGVLVRKEKIVTKIPVFTVTLGNNSFYKKKYNLIDYYDWIDTVYSNRKKLKRLVSSEEVDEIIEIRSDCDKFITLTSSSLNLNDKERIDLIQNILSDGTTITKLTAGYNIFMKHCEEIQVHLLESFSEFREIVRKKAGARYGGSSSPVIILPFSFGLNRVCNELYRIRDFSIDDEPIYFDKSLLEKYAPITSGRISNLKKKDGLSRYYGESYTISDIPRITNPNCPIKLFHVELPKLEKFNNKGDYTFTGNKNMQITQWERLYLTDLLEADKDDLKSEGEKVNRSYLQVVEENQKILNIIDNLVSSPNSKDKLPKDPPIGSINESIDLLTDKWISIFKTEVDDLESFLYRVDKKKNVAVDVPKEVSAYAHHLIAIKEAFVQYLFYGNKELDVLEGGEDGVNSRTESMYLLHYPLLLSDKSIISGGNKITLSENNGVFTNSGKIALM